MNIANPINSWWRRRPCLRELVLTSTEACPTVYSPKRLYVFLIVFLASAPLLYAGEPATNPPPAAPKPPETNAPAKSPPSAAGAATEPTIITADHLQGDYLHSLGTFEGNVLAVDPRMTVRADKMTVFFGGTNVVTSTGTNTTRSVQKLIAEGGVVITTPDNKKTNSDRAEYTAGDGKVVLTGHPRAESADGIVTGQKITFWRDSQKMDVEADQTETNRTRLLIYPEEQRKKE
jgi:lipopolysaccharide transport protein LptA